MKGLAFILYDSRSGSTLFSALLNQYRGVSVSHESAFASRILEYRDPLESEKDWYRLVEHLSTEPHFRELQVDISALLSAYINLDEPIQKRDLIKTTAEIYFADRDPGANVYVMKHAPYYYLGALVDMFPNIKFIHLIRDGRAVCSSKIRTSGTSKRRMERSVLKAAFDWRRKINQVDNFASNSITIRYEDLLSSPDSVLRKALIFLNVPEEKQVKTKSRSSYHNSIGLLQRHLHPNVAEELNPNFTTKWQNLLKPDETIVYELVCRDSLLRNGYELVELNRPKTIGRQFQYSIALYRHFVIYFYVRLSNLIFTIFKSGKAKNKVQARLMRRRLEWLIPFRNG